MGASTPSYGIKNAIGIAWSVLRFIRFATVFDKAVAAFCLLPRRQ